ncbi:MAG: hypothetical protein EXR99_13315 [Gemmataceae bacterium]|nr:hypothetical protein [Gemmataceae bacterium]
MLCRSCNRTRANRPRGLCYSCYYKPEVRERFPSTSKFAQRGKGIGVEGLKLSLEPTLALPGTEAKMLILMERLARGEELFHPLDTFIPYPDYSPREAIVA